MSKIISIQLESENIDVNKEFWNYKYAIQEHAPIKLSNDKWLHTYRVTKYRDFDPHGDPDEETEMWNKEAYD